MTRIAQQVSRAIRILRGNRDESARASHLVVNKEQIVNNFLLQVNQAEREKCSQSTFSERKIMKTAFKRVALVAAAALAIGGISAVSANAAQSVTVAATGIAGSNSAGYTLSQVTGTYASLTITGAADHSLTITSAGVGTLYFPASAPTNSLISGSLWYAGATVPGASTFAAATAGNLVVSAFSATAGTQTITLVGDVGGTTTLTITWGAANVFSASNSWVVANNATDVVQTTVGTTASTLKATSAAADTSLKAVGTGTAGTNLAGGALVALYNNASTPAAWTADKITASVTGPGLLTISDVTPTGPISTTGSTIATANTTSQGRSVSTGTAGAYALVQLYNDGTTGTATVTISDSTAGVVIGTFTATFYSNTIAKLVATVNDARIVAAYREIYKEIESLRLYDRGEKTIVAPNLADIMPSIQQSR